MIVILNWNGLPDTLNCLSSIQKITYPNYEVVVIDNGSRSNDVEVIKAKFGNSVCVIKQKVNLGFSGGSNVGIGRALHSGAEYVLLLNNDTVVDSKFLTEMVKVSENDMQVGIVGPKIYHYEQPKKIYSTGIKVNLWTGNTDHIADGEIDDGRFDALKKVDCVSGCALLIKEKTIKAIGLLCETYFAYYEETEWCLKARKAGFKVVYAPKARIWHKTHSVKKSNQNAMAVYIYYLTRNRFLFMKRNSDALRFVVFTLFFFLTDSIFRIGGEKLFMRPKLFFAYVKGIYAGLRSLSLPID